MSKDYKQDFSKEIGEHSTPVIIGTEPHEKRSNIDDDTATQIPAFIKELETYLKGGNDVVVDLAEDGKSIQIRLDRDVTDAITLQEIDEKDISVNGEAEGGAVISIASGYLDDGRHHKLIVEVETSAAHCSTSLELCPYNADVCFAGSVINLGGTFKNVSAGLQADGSVTINIVNGSLSSSDSVIIHYLTYKN